MFQIFNVVSAEPDAILLPSGEKEAERTQY